MTGTSQWEKPANVAPAPRNSSRREKLQIIKKTAGVPTDGAVAFEMGGLSGVQLRELNHARKE